MTQCNASITIGGMTVNPGERKTVDLVVGKLYTHSELTMPVQIICGKQQGPVLFVSAAIHGDELNGVEIIRRLLKVESLNELKGTLIAVPIVNLHGFINHTRYLPDRRDLNRSFPGSVKGSIAGRMAHLFLNEIVKKATHGIDLHTGAINRSNLPQVRANLDDKETMRMAEAFSAPLMLNSNLRDGSLRAAAVKKNIPILLYEAGEALRFDELSIRGGVRGVINVMRELEMLELDMHDQHASSGDTQQKKPIIAETSFWMRAPHSGIFRSMVKDGKHVIANETLLGVISDPFGESEVEIVSPSNGIIIGHMKLPLVNEGEALYHIAKFARSDIAAESVDEFHVDMSDDSVLPYPTEDIPDF